MNPHTIKPLIALLLICGALVCACSSPDPKGQGETTAEPIPDENYPEAGLYIRDGKFRKDGYAYYGMGVNYMRLFSNIVEEGALPDVTLDGLKQLADHGIPFARIMGCPFWPNGWRESYLKDKEAYFEAFDIVVRAAEEYGVGLIPSLFWTVYAIPDIMGEHMDQFSNDDSKTIAFIRQYTAEVVQRYKDSPAIWGWEYGNEFNNIVDIPNGYVPDIVPGKGTPETRDPVRDCMKHDYMLNAFRVFGNTVRQYDQTRPIFSGNTEPRSSAWHNSKYDPGQYWVQDSEQQYREMVALFEGDPINTITIRGYCNQPPPKKNYPLSLDTPSAFIAKMQEFSRELGKPLFVGEFAAPDQWAEEGDGWTKVPDVRRALQQRIDAFVENEVQLSCLWVYDLPSADWDCNATFNNERRYALDAVIRANKKLKRLIK